ncbi:MAG: 16S rRNA (uracil(1498)-N(3))-methyltransferase [Myxococcota bacterium]
MKRRIRVPVGSLRAGPMRLPAEAAHYARDVLRLRAKDRVELFDGAGGYASAEITRAESREVEAELEEPLQAAEPDPPRITLIQAVGKSDKIDQVIRQASELGVARVVVVTTERTVAERQHKLERWRGIAEDGTRVSGRYFVPEIVGVLSLPTWLEEPRAALSLLLDGGAERSMKDILDRASPPLSLALAVGPEGGFSPQERFMLESKGFLRARLGRHTLRTETAGPAALAALTYAFDPGKVPETRLDPPPRGR